MGGRSTGPWASLNVSEAAGDDPARVAENRALLGEMLPRPPQWMRQVHGSEVHVRGTGTARVPVADAQVSFATNEVCAVLTADCLPVFLADRHGEGVGMAHAGWRGLCGGVLHHAVEAMRMPAQRLQAWLGPCIAGPCYEVGPEVRSAFVEAEPGTKAAFTPAAGRWRLDLSGAARIILQSLGVTDITGADVCTACDAERFFSHRRDGTTGRMAHVIWLEGPEGS
jgi:YfiH family protein